MGLHNLFVLLAVVFTITIASPDPENPLAVRGPFETRQTTFSLNTGSSVSAEEDKATVYYPVMDSSYNATSFKYISYAHGMFGGGVAEVPGYNTLLHAMASFGYIIGATHQCSVGCYDDCRSLKDDPKCFGNYYKKQLNMISWAKECSGLVGGCSEPFQYVDFSEGVGIAGHSMGGQATVFSSSANNATDFDIRAAVMHHAYTHDFPPPTIPFLDFTGEQDTTSPASTMAVPIYQSAASSKLPRGLVDKTNANHHEPDVSSFDKNGIELLAQFSAAWFKLYLDKTPQALGLDFHEMIYGASAGVGAGVGAGHPLSLCTGADGPMTQCVLEGQN